MSGREHRSMNVTGRRSLAAATLLAALTACAPPAQRDAPPATPAAMPATAPAADTTPGGDMSAGPRYPLRGKIVGVDAAGKKLIVDHESIPGFMSAMTMPYEIKDETLLSTLQPGDEITAQVTMTGAHYWLENVRVTGRAGLTSHR